MRYHSHEIDFQTLEVTSVVYHTNVILSVGTTWAVVCLAAIPSADQRLTLGKSLESTGHEIIEISIEQAKHFCGNILELRSDESKFTPKKLLIAMSTCAYEAFHAAQRARLLAHVDELVHSPLETIESVAGGSARCMIAELFPHK